MFVIFMKIFWYNIRKRLWRFWIRFSKIFYSTINSNSSKQKTPNYPPNGI